MRNGYEVARAEQIQIEGHVASGRDILVPPPNWVDFAKRHWPNKTAAQLAAIAGRDERTAKRWLSGEYEPPMPVVVALVTKLFERG